MDNQVHNQIVSFIWGIADDCLRDVYVRGKYRDVILPMTVIRRLDALLEDSKEAVLDMKKKLDAAGIDNQWPALCNVAGQAFCNASPFRLRDLTSRAKKQTLETDFEAYLDGFSPNVQEILEKFKFRNQIDTMIEADILGAVIEKFISSDINLSPNPVYKDEEKTILKHPGLDNHGMGTIFEELIRKFNEENNEEAGEHWTPRDVVELMADLIFMPIADQIKDATYSCYDGACGTGGMLTVAQDRLVTLAARRGKNVSIHLFGQEINPETYAICKADMLLKGDGDQAEHISYGSTLSLDGNATRQFDFMLSNPPYGKSWKTDAEKMGGKKEILDSRFNAYLDGGEQLTMIPRTSDGQLLFLLNNVAKMKKDTPLGSRIAEVHNGSSIFTGDAGSGESNARRYMIENDLVEAIIAVPENMCSTGDINAQFKGKDVFTFKPSHSIVLCTNHMPSVKVMDSGTWDRLIVVPFRGRFRSQENEIKNYGNYLVRACGGAILSWIIDGAREYIRNDYKLDIPECIISATEQYQQENDWLTDFFNEWVALDKNEDTYGSDIYGAYTSFCSEHGERMLPMSSVLPLVEAKAGATKKRTKKGNVYQGLRIISEFERAAS